jgi:hypothetical protein
VIKNLAFSVRLDLLHEIYPDAYFIFVTREKVAQTLSILQARRKNKIPQNKIWSIMPENFREIEKENNEMMLVVKQIFYIEKQIYRDLQSFTDDHVITVKYEDLIQDFESILQTIAKTVNFSFRDEYPKLSELSNTSKEADPALLVKLNQCISQFNWKDYDEHRN